MGPKHIYSLISNEGAAHRRTTVILGFLSEAFKIRPLYDAVANDIEYHT